MSVVIAAYDEERHVGRLLRSLARQTLPPTEVIVADDGSRDRTAAVAEEHGATVLRLPHRGPALARNAGVEAANGAIVVFADADMTCDRAFGERLTEPIRAERAAGSFTRDIWVGNSETAWAQAYCAIRRLPFPRLLPAEFPDEWDQVRAIRREPFLAVGGYDDVGYGEDKTVSEKLGEGTDTGEDTIFSRRCAQAGETVGFEPRATLAHENLTGLKDSAAHHLAHGRGLVRAVERTEYRSAAADLEQSTASAAMRLLAVYPCRHLALTARRLWRHERRELRRFLSLAPLIAVGLLATGLGAFGEWRAVRLRSPRSS